MSAHELIHTEQGTGDTLSFMTIIDSGQNRLGFFLENVWIEKQWEVSKTWNRNTEVIKQQHIKSAYNSWRRILLYYKHCFYRTGIMGNPTADIAIRCKVIGHITRSLSSFFLKEINKKYCPVRVTLEQFSIRVASPRLLFNMLFFLKKKMENLIGWTKFIRNWWVSIVQRYHCSA